LANYIYISPLTAMLAAILAAVLGMPVWLVVLSFLVAGSAAALAIGLVILFRSRHIENSEPECDQESSQRHPAAATF
jgi:hypothetical protein